MEKRILKVDEIYVPVKRRKTLNMTVVNEIAESMLEEGQLTPKIARHDLSLLRFFPQHQCKKEAGARPASN